MKSMISKNNIEWYRCPVSLRISILNHAMIRPGARWTTAHRKTEGTAARANLYFFILKRPANNGIELLNGPKNLPMMILNEPYLSINASP